MSGSTERRLAPGRAPAGWSEDRGPWGARWSAPGWSEGFAPLDAPEQGAAGTPLLAGGRARVRLLQHPRGAVVVRSYQRGGLLRGLRSRGFAGPERALAEARLGQELLEAGLQVATPVLVRARPIGSRRWDLELGTVHAPNAQDLRQVLSEPAPDRLLLRALARAAGELVRKAHALGLDHVDLQPANLLHAGTGPDGQPRLLLLDLDRCTRHAALPEGVRLSNLARLERWLWGRSEGAAVGARERAAFLHAYEPDRLRRRALARAVAGRVQRRRVWQRAGRLLERLLGLRRL